MSCPSEAAARLLQEYLDSQYEKAGEIVEEEENQISIASNCHLLSDPVALILEAVLEEKPLGFVLQDFQKLCLHAIGCLKNVVLVSPTGTGKMIVAYLAIPGKPLNSEAIYLSIGFKGAFHPKMKNSVKL